MKKTEELFKDGKLTLLQVYSALSKSLITQEEWDTIYSGFSTDTFENLQMKKLVDLEIWYNGIASLGYEVPTKGFSLAMRDSDSTEFTKQLTLVKSLVEAGQLPLSTELTIVCVDKSERKLTAQEILQTLPAYGVYVNTCWSTKTGYSTYIKSLTDTEENRTILENLQFSIG